MSALDTLLALLAEDNRNIPARMRAAGFGEDQLGEAWDGLAGWGSLSRPG